MKGGLSVRQKLLIVFICFFIAVFGFMLKLPSAFRHIDKELHAAFYFSAAAFLNILFVKRKLIRHIAVFFFLALFGMGIEWAQAWSNRFFRKRIHGRFDPQDLEANVVGLLAFSALWVMVMISILVYKGLSKGNKAVIMNNNNVNT